MNKIIQELNGERATRKLPDFNPGDTIVVQVKVVEGDRERELDAVPGQAVAHRCDSGEGGRPQQQSDGLGKA